MLKWNHQSVEPYLLSEDRRYRAYQDEISMLYDDTQFLSLAYWVYYPVGVRGDVNHHEHGKEAIERMEEDARSVYN